MPLSGPAGERTVGEPGEAPQDSGAKGLDRCVALLVSRLDQADPPTDRHRAHWCAPLTPTICVVARPYLFVDDGRQALLRRCACRTSATSSCSSRGDLRHRRRSSAQCRESEYVLSCCSRARRIAQRTDPRPNRSIEEQCSADELRNAHVRTAPPGRATTWLLRKRSLVFRGCRPT